MPTYLLPWLAFHGCFGPSDAPEAPDVSSDGDADVDTDTDGDADADTDDDSGLDPVDCPAYRDHGVACNPSVDADDWLLECVCFDETMRQDFARPFLACLTELACAEADPAAVCSDVAGSGLEPTVDAEAYHEACHARWGETCGEDLCHDVAVMTDEYIAEVLPCLDQPRCEDAYSCRNEVFTAWCFRGWIERGYGG